MTIRVLLVEDQTMMLDAIATILELEPDIVVVDRVRSAEEAIVHLGSHTIDVLVTDIELPGASGLELAARFREYAVGCKIVVLTTFSRSGYLRRALDLGVSGYLLKDSSPRELADAIRRVHAGGRWIDAELAQRAWMEPDPLTARQREILRLVEAGRSNAAIAATLGLAEGTVKNHMHDAMGRLSARNRTEAARVARENGWL